MKLGKQAKILTLAQQTVCQRYLLETQEPVRNQVVFLLSFKAGLRAKEIANLRWHNLTTSDGEISDTISLQSKMAKKGSGGHIPIHPALKNALETLRAQSICSNDDFIIQSQRGRKEGLKAHSVVIIFKRWYRALGFDGCSSHSGRRTMITNAAKSVSKVGGSIRDVQMLARHSSLALTQLYIEADPDAQRKIINML
jgi:integrase